MEHQNLTHKDTFMLIAKNFDENFVVHCLSQLRDEGMPVKLVGLTPGLMSGSYGIQIRPDTNIAQVLKQAISLRFLIIAGGEACASILLSDPRVFELIKNTFKQGGIVASMAPIVEEVLSSMILGCDFDSQLLLPKGRDPKQFVNLLINNAVT